MADSLSQRARKLNQRTYQHLRLALSLNLRRQILIAVCDDLQLRDRVSQQLQADLNPKSEASAVDAVQSTPPILRSRLVSLVLDLDQPDPVGQMTTWLQQRLNPQTHPVPRLQPRFQILGVEHLTRQPASIQRHFLSALRHTEVMLPALETSWVLWLTRPWAYTIQQSVPEFWRWRTGVFEFVGDPTPMQSTLDASHPSPVSASFSPRPAPSSGQPLPKGLNGDKADDLWTILTQNPVRATRRPSRKPAPAKEPLRETTAPAVGETAPRDRTHAQSSSPLSTQKAGATASLSALSTPLRQATEQPISGLNALADASFASEAQALEILRRIDQELHRQPLQIEPLVLAYQELGNIYRDRLNQDNPDLEDLTIAIQAYEEGARWAEQATLPTPELLNDLGNLYWLRSRHPSQVNAGIPDLQSGIAAYQRALTQISLPQHGTMFAMVQHNLGTAYGDLAQHEQPIENLRSAIYCYQRALSYRSPEVDPVRYAATQNNLGTAYWKLAQHDHTTVYLQQAIAAYTEALRYSRPEDNPRHYGMILNNLGTAYWQLAQHDPSPNWLQAAIQAYEDALQYRTLDTDPAAYASTQNNLGVTYRMLSEYNADDPDLHRQCLERSIDAYAQAIAAVQILRQHLPNRALSFDLGSTHNGLGLSHRQLVAVAQMALDDSEKVKHLETALEHHLQALQCWSHNSELSQMALGQVIQTIRTCYEECGLPGQNAALSHVPGHLLSEVLARL